VFRLRKQEWGNWILEREKGGWEVSFRGEPFLSGGPSLSLCKRLLCKLGTNGETDKQV
jgi:hypothetical protein